MISDPTNPARKKRIPPIVEDLFELLFFSMG